MDQLRKVLGKSLTKNDGDSEESEEVQFSLDDDSELVEGEQEGHDLSTPPTRKSGNQGSSSSTKRKGGKIYTQNVETKKQKKASTMGAKNIFNHEDAGTKDRLEVYLPPLLCCT